MADFLPFCFSHAYQIIKSNFFFTSKDGGELLFYFSLAILDLGILGRQIEESKFPRAI